MNKNTMIASIWGISAVVIVLALFITKSASCLWAFAIAAWVTSSVNNS